MSQDPIDMLFVEDDTLDSIVGSLAQLPAAVSDSQQECEEDVYLADQLKHVVVPTSRK